MDDERISFGEWSLAPLTRVLAGPGGRVTLGSRAADLLMMLIRANGEVIAKDELIRRAWNGLTVDDSNLSVQIAALRKAFGNSGNDIVVTVPGRGYRLGGTLPSPAELAVAAASGGPPSLAVLPLRVIGGQQDDAEFADGMAEELITVLSRVRSFFVLARNSSFTLRGREITPREAGRELGVRYVLTGSIRRADARMRVNFELDDTADGVSIWSDRFDYALTDIFALQDRIVANVVGAIEPSLRRAELDRIERAPTQNATAYELYLRSTSLVRVMSRANCDAALARLDQAMAIDPTFARAMSAAAGCWAWRVSQSFREPGRREEDEALKLAERAILHGADDAIVLSEASWVLAYMGHRNETAVELARRAVALHPNSAKVRSGVGWTDLFNDECVSAIIHFEEALRYDPFDPATGDPLGGISTAHLGLGNVAAAVEWGEKAVAAKPERQSTHRAYVAALGMAGLPAEAAVARLLELDPTFNVADYTLRMAHHMRRAPKQVSARLEGVRRAGVPERRR